MPLQTTEKCEEVAMEETGSQGCTVINMYVLFFVTLFSISFKLMFMFVVHKYLESTES